MIAELLNTRVGSFFPYKRGEGWKEKQKLQITRRGAAAAGEPRAGKPGAAAGLGPRDVTSRGAGRTRGGPRLPRASPRPAPARPVPGHVASPGSKSNGGSGPRRPHGGGRNEHGRHPPAEGALPPQRSGTRAELLVPQPRWPRAGRGTGSPERGVPPSSRGNWARKKAGRRRSCGQ